MKKKNFVVPAIWLIAIAAGYGAYKWISYQIDIYYSNLAAEQFGNDSAYGQLKFQPTAQNIILIVFMLIAILLFYRFLKSAGIIASNKREV